jgi:hypothetical protein
VDAPADTLLSALATACPTEAVAWLQAQRQRIASGDERALFLALGQAGRKIGRAPLPGGWSADQTARTLLVLALPSQDPTRWLATLDRCFHAGTVEELIALYQALPLLPHPQLLAARAAEGVRSGMAPVFAAIALDNPFPAAHLGEAAWNQMVLKAFFTAADVDRILGLRDRLNADLGRMLAGYARERRIAGRTLDPRLPPLARACGSDCPDTP